MRALRLLPLLGVLAASAVSAQDTTRTPRPAVRDTVVRPRRDTVTVVPANPRADTIPVVGDTARPKPDSARPAVPLPAPKRASFDSLYGDTLGAPIAHAEAHASPAIGPALHWDRTELFASGALTLDELISQATGITTFTSGWLVAPHVAALGGDFSRVRVFLDGLEVDRMDPVYPEALDLTAIPLWSLEDVSIERVAGEVRVHLRTWRVQSLTPRTRTDIFTGDRQTEVFRGLFGQRYHNNLGLQLGGQALSTVDNRRGGGGDQQTYLTRFAWAKRGWSVDAYGVREQHRRTETGRIDGKGPRLPKRGIRNTIGYARLGYGDPDAGPWAQLVAAGMGSAEPDPPNDSTRAPRAVRMQYLLTGGTSLGPARVSLAQRMRVFGGGRFASTSARASLDRRFLSAEAFAERDGLDSLTRVDLTGRLTPLPWVSLLGSVGRRSFTDTLRPDAADIIVEAGLRLRGTLWLSGGITTRDSSRLAAPRMFDTSFVDASESRATATLVALRGRVWKDVYTDIHGARWSDSGAFRPRYEGRAEVGVRTRWLTKFPSGSFSLLAAMAQDYRSAVIFPTATGASVAGAARTFNTILEIRILSAVLTWQYRNPFGSYNEGVSGFYLPRRQNLYGVRWDWYD